METERSCKTKMADISHPGFLPQGDEQTKTVTLFYQ